jgi:hypothetical protein
MPQVTIRCPWCGKEFESYLFHRLSVGEAVSACERHEQECERNPANEKKNLSVAIVTTSIYGPRMEGYLPTDEDKKIVNKIKSILAGEYIPKSMYKYVIGSDMPDVHVRCLCEANFICDAVSLFERLGLINKTDTPKSP